MLLKTHLGIVRLGLRGGKKYQLRSWAKLGLVMRALARCPSSGNFRRGTFSYKIVLGALERLSDGSWCQNRTDRDQLSAGSSSRKDSNSSSSLLRASCSSGPVASRATRSPQFRLAVSTSSRLAAENFCSPFQIVMVLLNLFTHRTKSAGYSAEGTTHACQGRLLLWLAAA